MTANTTDLRVHRPALDAIRTMDPLLLLLRASLLALLVNSNDDVWILVAVAATCVIALPRPAVLRSPLLWSAAFVGIGLRQLATWHAIDDHVIVTTYWCGALALGLTARDQRITLAASARFLIGALFAFAAGWKLLSGQFVDGSFFRYTLLFDERFETLARVVGGTTSAAHGANVDDVSALLSGRGDGELALREGPRNVAVAQVFTWWGIVIESVVAVTFLAPLRESWVWLRHASLIAFAATTYVVVPVGGFGTILLVLGAAMATSDELRLKYLAGAGVLLIWSAVWPLMFL